jgi:hypothetical protein
VLLTIDRKPRSGARVRPRVIDGYEAMHMIRKGQVRWFRKGDVIGQRAFIHNLFRIPA